MPKVETIVAIATPNGIGALGIVRLSGPDAWPVAEACFRARKQGQNSRLSIRKSVFGDFLAEDGTLLDEVLMVRFQGPHSFTGEDSVEISFHGSVYILQTALHALCQKGARLATPGEFTLRSFLNGKMDLTQAEAVADVIASENAAGHRLAFRQLKGAVSDRMRSLRQELIDTTALLELELDFAEEDVEFAHRSQFYDLLDRSLFSLQQLIGTFHYGNALKNGIPIALVGAPNAGKSTLLNALLQEDRALVSEVAGTTRDTIEEQFQAGGFSFRLVDTAGLRETVDAVEKMGIDRTLRSAEKAEIVLFLVDSTAWNANPSTARKLADSLALRAPQAHHFWVYTQCDKAMPQHPVEGALVLSAKTGEGLAALSNALIAFMENNPAAQSDIILTNQRHVEAFQHTVDALIQAKAGLKAGISGELVAVDLRDALRHLGSVTGQVVADDLLGSIFSRFCIGK